MITTEQITHLLALYANESGDIIIQTFDDSMSAANRPELFKTLRGITPANIKKLIGLRDQGAGVFILNPEIGYVCSMTFQRGPIKALENSKIPPQVIVKTASGEHKCLWLFQTSSISLDFAQTTLCNFLQNNPHIGNAGIFHVDNDFFQTNIINLSDDLSAYSGAEVQEIIEDSKTGSPSISIPGILFSKNLHPSVVENELMTDNHGLLTIEETIRKVFVRIRNRSRRKIGNNSNNSSRPLREFILNGHDITNIKLPEREIIIGPFMPSASLSMLFAVRGIGKTWFCLQMALSISLGAKFFEWEVPKARRVLYIDGEMPLQDIQNRLKLLNGNSIPENLLLLSSEKLQLEDKPLNLSSEEGQQRVKECLLDLEDREEQPDVIIFDNLSSLCSGGDENSNKDIESLLRWLTSLRHLGYAILLVHHAGKNGEQRGASRREDFLENSIKLTSKSSGGTAKGAKFSIEFTKCRGKRPSPDKLCVELISGQGGVTWATDQTQEIPAIAKYLAYIRDKQPETQATIAKEFSVSPPRVSVILAEARKNGYLVQSKLDLTPKGLEYLNKFNADEL